MNFDANALQRKMMAHVRERFSAEIESVRCDEHPEERPEVEWDAEDHMQIKGSCPSLKAKIEQKLAEIGARQQTP